MPAESVLEFTDVSVDRDNQNILRRITWKVNRNQHWVILGSNGSGKTTLCALASLYLHPSSGNVAVLGKQLGRVNVREVRRHLGVTSQTIAQMLRPSIRVLDVVTTGIYAALEPCWHSYTELDYQRAHNLLKQFHSEQLLDNTFSSLSSGERQRVLLARTLISKPSLLLLDEPTAGLDLGGREELIELLGQLATNPTAPTTVMVTHHLEEIPCGFSHAMLLKNGQILESGPINDTLTSKNLSECFGIPIEAAKRRGRWSARKTNT